MAYPPVFDRVRRPAFLAINKERRTGNPVPQFLDLGDGHLIGWIGSDIIIEFPAIGPVLVLVDPVLGKVPRLFGGEVPVRLMHAPESVFDRDVAARQTTGKSALLADPGLHAFSNTPPRSFGEAPRRRSEPLDCNQSFDMIGIDAGIAQCDHASQ